MIRVRFAPSPTGWMHIGTARSGLMSWLFARKHGGVFILRIEDTDKERSTKEFEEDIISGMKTLGLNWDEFYRQSERYSIYREHLEKLIVEHKAYHCFCTKEEIDTDRKAAEAAGGSYRYDGKCSHLTEDEVSANLKAGKPFVIRFKIPEEKISWNDIIRGHIEFDMSLLGDIVIAKSMDEPLYNFTVVVDDALMKITHVIRGEDHVPNTPKQIAIFKALGYEAPSYAHLPLILAADRSKMSKRYAETALSEYLRDGYLPEAIVNFIALLGWHPKGDEEILTIEQLLEQFDIERVQKGGAVFDLQKLSWINRHYIAHILSVAEVAERSEKFLPEGRHMTPEIAEAVRSRIDKLSEMAELTEFFFVEPEYAKEMIFFKGKEEGITANLEQLSEALSSIEDWGNDSLSEAVFRVVPDDKKGEYLWPLRVCLSGREKSPGPIEIMIGLGKERSLDRIAKAIAKLS